MAITQPGVSTYAGLSGSIPLSAFAAGTFTAAAAGRAPFADLWGVDAKINDLAATKLSGSIALARFAAGTFTADAAGRAPFTDGIWLDAKFGALAGIALSKLEARQTTLGQSTAARTTTSTTRVHSGDAISHTPKTTIVIVICVVDSVKDDTAASEIRCTGRYGTGTAPATGAAETGTQWNAGTIQLSRAQPSGANEQANIMLAGRISALTVGTAYWFDLSWSVSAGTGTLDARNYVIMDVEG